MKTHWAQALALLTMMSSAYSLISLTTLRTPNGPKKSFGFSLRPPTFSSSTWNTAAAFYGCGAAGSVKTAPTGLRSQVRTDRSRFPLQQNTPTDKLKAHQVVRVANKQLRSHPDAAAGWRFPAGRPESAWCHGPVSSVNGEKSNFLPEQWRGQRSLSRECKSQRFLLLLPELPS